MFKEFFRHYFAKKIYPTYSRNWYKCKGYVGESKQAIFADFVAQQKKPGAIYYNEFKFLRLTRHFVAHREHNIDAVIITPNKKFSNDKPGAGLYIICFRGKREYYESKFREMAIIAKETGSSVVGFNPKGFQSSTGSTKILDDIIEDGIKIVEYLLAKGIDAANIIFYGNSLGAAVQDSVNEYFKNSKSINFRQINSNSFRSLAAVIATNLKLSFLEKILYHFMKYIGWEFSYSEDFYKTGIYKCYLTRKDDKVIKKQDSFCSRVNLQSDINNAPSDYVKDFNWLHDNAEIILLNNKEKNIHNLNLPSFFLKSLNEHGHNLSIWHFFNRYLESSNKYVKQSIKDKMY